MQTIHSAMLAGVAFLLASGAALASTVTFDLTLDPGDPNYGKANSSITQTVDGVTATFDAKAFHKVEIDEANNEITGGTIHDGDIVQWSNGAGAYGPVDSQHTVDGFNNYDDYIQITFSEEVTFENVMFTYFDEDQQKDVQVCVSSFLWWCKQYETQTVEIDGDDFRWMYDSNEDGTIGAGDYISENISENPFSDFGGVTNDVFAIGAFEKNDSWKLKSVTVGYDVAVVPLPATGLLLIAAVGGLGLVRRSRRA